MQQTTGYNLGVLFAIAEHLCDLATKKTDVRFYITKHYANFAITPLKLLATIETAKNGAIKALKEANAIDVDELEKLTTLYRNCFEYINTSEIEGVLSLTEQGNVSIGYHSIESLL